MSVKTAGMSVKIVEIDGKSEGAVSYARPIGLGRARELRETCDELGPQVRRPRSVELRGGLRCERPVGIRRTSRVQRGPVEKSSYGRDSRDAARNGGPRAKSRKW
jgi:hypothetical protein